MPAASEAVGAPGGGGDVEQEYEIRNDEGFVYKVPRGLYPDAAPSTTQSAAGLPDPRAAGLRRRRRALLRLRAKRLRDLSRWEALASEHLAPLPAPQPPALPSQSPPASSHLVAAAAFSSSSASVLDELIAQVDIQTELMKQVHRWCDEANAICDAGQAAIVDSIVALPLWCRKPSELMAGLCSPVASGNLDQQNGSQEASGVSSVAAQMIKNIVKKQTMAHELPPPILTESRTRKRVTNHPGSNNVASQASIESKRKKASGSTSTAPGTPGSTTRNLFLGRKKASGSTSTAPGTPGSTTRKATSTAARALDIVCSPGPQTRRRAAAQNGNVSPGGS